MRALMRSLAPTAFEDVAALVALYRPGPDGGEHAQRLRRPQERPQAGRVPPPRRRGGPRRHLRADDLPGVGDAGRAEVRRLLAGRGRQPPQGLRQEEPRAHRQGARRSSSTAASATGYGADLGDAAASTSSSRSPTTPSTSRTPTATASSPTRPPTSRRTTRSSTSPRCSPASRPTWTRRRSTSPSAARWASRCSCPTSTGRSPTSRRSSRRRRRQRAGVDRLRAVGGAQRGRGPGRAASSPSARPTGPFADFYDFCERVDTAVLNKRTIESLIKAGGFDSLGHPRQGLLAVLRADRRRHAWPAGASADMGVMSPVRRRSSDAGADVRRARRRSPTSSSTRSSGSPSRRRCSAST